MAILGPFTHNNMFYSLTRHLAGIVSCLKRTFVKHVELITAFHSFVTLEVSLIFSMTTQKKFVLSKFLRMKRHCSVKIEINTVIFSFQKYSLIHPIISKIPSIFLRPLPRIMGRNFTGQVSKVLSCKPQKRKPGENCGEICEIGSTQLKLTFQKQFGCPEFTPNWMKFCEKHDRLIQLRGFTVS